MAGECQGVYFMFFQNQFVACILHIDQFPMGGEKCDLLSYFLNVNKYDNISNKFSLFNMKTQKILIMGHFKEEVSLLLK